MTKIKIDELREQIEKKGLLNKKAFLVHSELQKNMESFENHLKEHLDYILELEDEGKLILAGPTWEGNEDYHGGQGIFILRASSLEEAKQITQEDPMVKNNVRSVSVQPFLICEGQLKFEINLSDSTVEFS